MYNISHVTLNYVGLPTWHRSIIVVINTINIIVIYDYWCGSPNYMCIDVILSVYHWWNWWCYRWCQCVYSVDCCYYLFMCLYVSPLLYNCWTLNLLYIIGDATQEEVLKEAGGRQCTASGEPRIRTSAAIWTLSSLTPEVTR